MPLDPVDSRDRYFFFGSIGVVVLLVGIIGILVLGRGCAVAPAVETKPKEVTLRIELPSSIGVNSGTSIHPAIPPPIVQVAPQTSSPSSPQIDGHQPKALERVASKDTNTVVIVQPIPVPVYPSMLPKVEYDDLKREVADTERLLAEGKALRK